MKYRLGQKAEILIHKNGHYTSYALVGLTNSFGADRRKFITMLSNGPPAECRWLIWKFMAKRILVKKKGMYERMLSELDKKSTPVRDIKKDIERTFPEHKYLGRDHFGP
jgi:hypothetical protein